MPKLEDVVEPVVEAVPRAVKPRPAPALRSGPKEIENICKHDIYLTSGKVKPGDKGIATVAEISCLLGKYIKEV